MSLKEQSDVVRLDREWVLLMKEAKALGLTPEEVKKFIEKYR
ncbi:anti-repressor SinI family protein [Piscibacillus halophilus]|nr:anti-repressor SinI family protein [Piscibacillus halophilus]